MAPPRRPLTICACIVGGVTALYPWFIADVDDVGGAIFVLAVSALLALPFAVLVRAHPGWNRTVAWVALAVMVVLAAATLAPSTLDSSSTASIGIVFLPFGLGAVVLAAYAVDAIARRGGSARRR